jgi:hypothetical protein
MWCVGWPGRATLWTKFDTRHRQVKQFGMEWHKVRIPHTVSSHIAPLTLCCVQDTVTFTDGPGPPGAVKRPYRFPW